MVQDLLGSSQHHPYHPIALPVCLNQPANFHLFLNTSGCSPSFTEPSLGSLLPIPHGQTLLKGKKQHKCWYKLALCCRDKKTKTKDRAAVPRATSVTTTQRTLLHCHSLDSEKVKQSQSAFLGKKQISKRHIIGFVVVIVVAKLTLI